MPHSLRVKLKELNSKGILRDTDTNRLIKALDTVDGLQDAIAEINGYADKCTNDTLKVAYITSLEIIQRYTKVGDTDATDDGLGDALDIIRDALDIINKHTGVET